MTTSIDLSVNEVLVQAELCRRDFQDLQRVCDVASLIAMHPDHAWDDETIRLADRGIAWMRAVMHNTGASVKMTVLAGSEGLISSLQPEPDATIALGTITAVGEAHTVAESTMAHSITISVAGGPDLTTMVVDGEFYLDDRVYYACRPNDWGKYSVKVTRVPR